MQFEYKIEGGDFANAGYASSEVKKILKQINIDPKIIKRVVVALYEAEVNVCAHAYRGKVIADVVTEKIEVTIIDEGPGIPSIENAMKEGFSTASAHVREMGFGAGMGLPNIKKNTDEMNMESVVNEGTTLKFTNYLHST